MKPKSSRDQLIGSLNASHFTTEDPTEPDSIATASNMPQVSHEPCIPYSTVDSDDTVGWNSNPAAVLKRHVTADRGIRARSYPPAVKLTSAVDDWFGLAPLASPETLSESSSLASCGSSGAMPGLGYQRIMSAILPPRMDPILQSPAQSSNSRDCGLYLESADVVGDLATLSPCVENLPLPLAPRPHGPDIVPVQPCVFASSSSTVGACASSPDVVQETRSTQHGSEPYHAAANDSCHMQRANLPAEHRQHGDIPCDTSYSCERGVCACGNVRPDIVSTHKSCSAVMHDVVLTDD